MRSNSKKVYALLAGLMILSIALSIGLFFAGWVYLLKLSGDLGKIRTEVKYLNKEVTALDMLGERYKIVSESEKLAADSIPAEKNVSSFMADIESLAKANNIKIKESLIGYNNSKSKIADPSLSQLVKAGNYYVLNVKFTVEGSYQNYIKFLNQVYSLRRLTSISSMDLVRTNEAMANKVDVVKANFVSSIYVKR